jgi:RNA polymerase sigma factor (sigma-70 family)
MRPASARPYTEALEVLWGAGICSALPDGQLLARFLAARDPAGELAFELLVKRHGPMVERVCRQILDDPVDVHDAWQAVFLVLARRASAIRKRESLGSWLHGVAVRVANRTRANAIRQRVRERRTDAAAAAQALESEGVREVASSAIEREENAQVVHQEISRLPEKYRVPIVLCYMEGLTHDEAAASLNWPVGTVRSRLSRGRDKLRGRLSQHGLAAPAAVGPVGLWLAGNEAAPPAVAATLCAGSSTGIPDHVAKLVAALASQAANGSISATTTVPATSLTLAEGVLKMMTLKKLSVIAVVLLSLATLSAGGGLALLRTSGAQDGQPREKQSERTKPDSPFEIPPIAAADELAAQKEELVRLALERYELQLKRYVQGELPLAEMIDACDAVENAELRSRNPARTLSAIKERALNRFKSIERTVTNNYNAGQLSKVDLQEIKRRRLQAEIDLKTPDNEKIDAPAILRRLNELEKKVQELEKRLPPRSVGGSG